MRKLSNRSIAAVLIALLLIIGMTACAADNNGESDTPTQQPDSSASAAPTENGGETSDETYVMRIGTPTTNDIQTYEMDQFKTALEKAVGDRISVELYPSGQLGSNSEMLQGLSAGTIQALLEPTAFLGGFCSVLNVVDLPYFFETPWQATEILNSDAGDSLRAFLENQGITTASFYTYGDRVTLTTFPVDSVDSFKGKKIRVMGAQVLQDQFNAWGGAGIPMDVPELYTALQQGTIDGLESAPTFFNMGKYYEVAKTLFMEPRGAEITIFMMNKAWLESLPADLQDAVLAAAVEIRPLIEEQAESLQEDAIANMTGNGVTVTEASEELHDQLVELSQVVHENFLKANPDAEDIYNALKQAVDSK
jgi:TRAP-type C4-dicarboxylate transport system substrate-binding protein